jgi:Ribbon-helix-helix protein, copG family
MTGARPRNPARAKSGLDRSHADELATAEIVRAAPHPSAPVSIRLSAPLLERLDRIAETQHRKRSNLIQHILWEYVHGHDPNRG